MAAENSPIEVFSNGSICALSRKRVISTQGLVIADFVDYAF
jgi:hypothetical protein